MNAALEIIRDRADALPADFGDGWMSANAQDFARLGLIAGFDPQELAHRLARAAHPNRVMNARTVDRVLGEMAAA